MSEYINKKEECNNYENTPGHPINILILENKRIIEIIENYIKNPIYDISKIENREKLLYGFNELSSIDKHYQRKENIIFPYIEKYEITTLPKVMWRADDEIRDKIKSIRQVLSSSSINYEDITQNINDTIEKVKEMIFKEENIMIPMLEEKLTQDEWKEIEYDSKEIGYLQ